MRRMMFKSKATRDEQAKSFQKAGKTVHKSSTRNQQLHPEYVEDEDPELRAQTGFGNTVYRTHYKALYILEVEG